MMHRMRNSKLPLHLLGLTVGAMDGFDVRTGKVQERTILFIRRTALLQLLLLVVVSFFGMLGCSSGTIQVVTPTISLLVTQPPPASLLVGGTATVSATVSNDIANAGVDWVAVCVSTHPCGSFSPAHTDSGAATTFTAPADVPKKNTVAVTALSATDHSKSFSATVTITSNVSSVLIQSGLGPLAPPTLLSAGAQANLSAIVAGDPGNAGVDWTASCSSADCGSFVPAHTASGQITNFIAPSQLNNPMIVGSVLTITAASTADHNFTATAMVTITAPISIMFTQAPPTTMSTNAMAILKALVNGDLANGGVDWNVQCANAPCGSFAPAHTASGAPTSFTAPASSGTVFVNASSSTDPTQIVTATVTITAPISVVINIQGVTSSLFTGDATPTPPGLTATVMNDATNAGLDWSVTCGSADCGSFSPASHAPIDPSTTSATPTTTPTTYTAPATVPNGNIVTIVATSTADPTVKSAPLIITILPITPNSLLNGQFVFLMTGTDANQSFYSFAGTIAGDGQGNITNGEGDVVDSSVQLLASQITPLTGNYNIGTDGRGQINVILPSAASGFGLSVNNGMNSQITLSVSFVTPKHALLSETDAFGSGTGTLDLQNATDLAAFRNVPAATGLNGTYSLALSGAEMLSANNRFFLASALTFQFAAGTVTQSAATGDQSDTGAVTFGTATPNVTITTNPDNFGRFGDQGPVALGANSLQLIFYMIDTSHFVITDARDSFVFGGYMVAQPASPVISGTYTFAEAGATAPSAVPALQPQVAGGILTCSSSGVLDVTPLSGTATVSLPITSACTAPTNGRGLITVTGAGAIGIGQFAAYPTLDMGLQLIEIDGGGPSGSGVALPQTVHTPVLASAFNGKYASNFLATTVKGATLDSLEAFAGQIVSDGISKLSGTVDVNSFDSTAAPPVATPSPNASLSGSSYTANSNGRFPLTLNIATTMPQATKAACYVVDNKSCLLIGLDVARPGLGILQLQSLGF
jgi:hypothetical protein